jgi:hypothetical protein
VPFANRVVEDLMRIAGAGGGLVLDGSLFHTNDLMRIAGAASLRGARLELHGMSVRTTEELMQIAGAGKGAVVFAS